MIRIVNVVLFLMTIAFVLTGNATEIIASVVLLMILLLIVSCIQHYLTDRRFRQDCAELFTEEFYERLNTTINNEFY